MAVIPSVSDGQLIDTPWGNAVAAQINANTTALGGVVDVSKLPRGVVGFQQLATVFITAAPHNVYQDEGLAVTIAEPAGRRLRITINVCPYSWPNVLQGVAYQVMRNGVRVREWQASQDVISTVSGTAFTWQHITADTGAGGAGVVYKVQIKNVTANNQMASFGDVAQPRFLLIEDIGGV